MMEEELLDRLCPLPTEESEMEAIYKELEEKEFVITNMEKGGIFYHIIRIFVHIYISILALARNIISNLFVEYAEEDWLEVKAADYGKTRKQAVKTQGYVTIYRSDYENAVKICKGHMFKTKPDTNGKELKYYCLRDTVIAAGEESGRVLVEAEESGAAYNVAAGKIIVSMIHIEGMDYMINEEGWLYLEGAEIEELESFRARIGESWSELTEVTTESKLKQAVMEVDGVIGVKIDAQHPRGQGTTDIIIMGTMGTATPELLKRAEEKTAYLKGNYDDFLYKSAEAVKINIFLTVYLEKDISLDGTAERAEEIIRSMLQLDKRQELNCIYRDDIRYALMEKIAGCRRIVFQEPENDIEFENDKVVMPDEIQVTVQHLGGGM